MFVYLLILYAHTFVSCMIHKWRSEDNLWEWVLSFHNVGLWDRTEVIGLSSKCL